MQSGRGFRCFNCGKLLAVKLRGKFSVAFRCPRCKSYLFLKTGEPIPWVSSNDKEENRKEVVQ
jgi:phage FluMu protein Com